MKAYQSSLLIISIGLCTHVSTESVFSQTKLTAQNYLLNGKDKRLKGSYAESIEDFSQALKINPNLEEAYYNRGEAYLQAGRTDEALKDLNKAVELSPNEAMNYFKRGRVQYALQKYQLALWDLNKSVDLNPNNEEAYVERAKVLRKLGRVLQATEDCQKALNLVPNYARALSIRGLLKLDQDNMNGAYQDLKLASLYKPNEVEFHKNLAEYHQKNNQFEII